MATISSKKINFNGEIVTIFYERILKRPIVAIANILSIRGQLPGTPHNKATYTEEELTTFVATQLSVVKKIEIAMAEAEVAHLARRIEVKVKFTSIWNFSNFDEHIIFDELGIPLFHAWKVVPKFRDLPGIGGDNATAPLENAAQTSPITSIERKYISYCYEETKGTSYGYLALEKAIRHERNELCIFYWNWKFYTVHMMGNQLHFLNIAGEWEHLYERVSLIRGPSLGCRQFIVNCVGMSDDHDSLMTVARGFRQHRDLMPHLDVRCEHMVSLTSVYEGIKSGDPVDLITINYANFNGNDEARLRVHCWLALLRKAGFTGVIVAFVWYWLEGGEFSQWVEDGIYAQVDKVGVRYMIERDGARD